MRELDLLMPIGQGQDPTPSLLELSERLRERDVRVWPHLLRDTEPWRSGDWKARVGALRVRLFRLARAPVALVLDGCTRVDAGTVLEAMDWLAASWTPSEEHPGVGMLGIWRGPARSLPEMAGYARNKPHFGCVLMSRAGLEAVKEMPVEGGCECRSAVRQVEAAGMQAVWHPTLTAYHRRHG